MQGLRERPGRSEAQDSKVQPAPLGLWVQRVSRDPSVQLDQWDLPDQ